MGELKIAPAGLMKQLMPGKYINTALINVLDNCIDERTIRYTIEMLEWCHTENWIVDSSGFALLQHEEDGKLITFNPNAPMKRTDDYMNLASIHVMQSVSALINGSSKFEKIIVMGLDRPITKTNDSTEQHIEFMKKLGYNIAWARESAAFKNIYCPGAKLYLPIQTYTIEQFEIFWKAVNDINFDGLSMPVRNLSMKQIALFLIYFHQLGIKEVHLLGTTKPLIIAFAAYMAKHIFQWISLDSTTWQQGARTARYMNPHDLSSEYLGDIEVDESIFNDCSCPYCHGKSFADIAYLPDTEKTYFLGSHNFWNTENFGKEVYEHCDNIIDLKYHLKSRFKPKRKKEIDQLCQILSIVRTYKDMDIRSLEKLLSSV